MASSLPELGGVQVPIKASDSPSIDAFGRWRVSSPSTLFDSKQLVDNQPLFWDDQQTDVARTNATTLSGGTTIYAGTGQSSNSGLNSDIGFLNTDFSFGTTIAGVSDIVVLAAQRVTGTTESFYASINWRDQQ